MATKAQKELLGQLAHMRVPHDDAWLKTDRLAELTGRKQGATHKSLLALQDEGLVEYGTGGWRITEAGRAEAP